MVWRELMYIYQLLFNFLHILFLHKHIVYGEVVEKGVCIDILSWAFLHNNKRRKKSYFLSSPLFSFTFLKLLIPTPTLYVWLKGQWLHSFTIVAMLSSTCKGFGSRGYITSPFIGKGFSTVTPNCSTVANRTTIN